MGKDKTVAQGNSGSREIKGTCTAETAVDFRRKRRKRNTTRKEVGVGRRDTSL